MWLLIIQILLPASSLGSWRAGQFLETVAGIHFGIFHTKVKRRNSLEYLITPFKALLNVYFLIVSEKKHDGEGSKYTA